MWTALLVMSKLADRSLVLSLCLTCMLYEYFRGEWRVLREKVPGAVAEGPLNLSATTHCAFPLSCSAATTFRCRLAESCAHTPVQSIFPLPTMSLFRPREEDLIRIAQEEPPVVAVPNRGTTSQACLFKGRRLNPAAFPDDVFINERRALLTGKWRSWR